MRLLNLRRKKRVLSFLLITTAIAGVLLWLGQKPAFAANPTTINFQGKVVDGNGLNVNSGTSSYSVVFRLYDNSSPTIGANCNSNSQCWWEETQTVSVTNGIFQVELGSTCAFISACNSSHSGIDWSVNNSLYLTMKFNGDAAGFMTPVIHMQTVPYAFNADRLGGLAATAFGQLSTNNSWAGTNTIALNNSSAFQVQNASNNEVLTVQTSATEANNYIRLGKASTINGRVVLNNSSNTNTITIVSGVTSGSSYTLTLPTALPGSTQCITSTNTGTLGFGACSAGSTLASTYSVGANQASSTLSLDSTRLGVIIKDNASPISGSLFTVQNNGGTSKYLDVTTSGISVSGDIYSAGISWTTQSNIPNKQWASVAYGNGMFVAVSSDCCGNNSIMSSPDGISWSTRTTPVSSQSLAVTYGNGLFVATTSSTSFVTSPDGITWTARSIGGGADTFSSIAYGSGKFVVVSSTGNVKTSPDGITWTARTAAASNSWNSVTFGNGLFVAVSGNGTGNRVMTSPDGITWTSRSTTGFDNQWKGVTYGNGTYVAVADLGTNLVMTSSDGITWTATASVDESSAWKSVAYGSGLFVAVSSSTSGSALMTSPNGTSWTSRSLPALNQWQSVTYGNGMFVSVGTSGTGTRVMTSGKTTSNITNISDTHIYGSTYLIGSALVQTDTNTISALQVQNAANNKILNVSTLTTGVNLVVNPSFELNTNGWEKKGAASVALTSSTDVSAQNGSRTLKVVTTAATGDGATYNFPFAASTSYSISFWAKSDSSTGANISFGHRENTTTGDVDCVSGASLTVSWQQFTCANFTANATVNDTAPTLGIYVKQTDATSRNIYIDSVTLTQTTTAQDYTPDAYNINVDANYSNITLNSANTAEIQPWRLNPNVLTTGCGGNREQAGTIHANGYLYVVGGYDGSAAQSTVCYSKIYADGSIGSWSTTTALPAVRRHLSVVSANGYLYAIGGADTAGTAVSTVYYSKLNGDGTVGTWQTNSQALPAARLGASVLFNNGFVYIVGGCTDTTCTANAQNTIYYGKVQADGSIAGTSTAAWTTNANNLPNARGMGSAAIANGYLYYVGGSGNTNGTPSTAGAKQDGSYAQVNSDGSISATVGSLTNLPAARLQHTTVIANGYLYVIAGCTAQASGACSASSAVSTVYYSKISSNGKLGCISSGSNSDSWCTSTNPLPVNRAAHTSAIINGYIYVIGGFDSSARTATTYYTSTSRVLVGGALDLVGLSAQGLSDFSGGGALTAGNTRVVGDLRVDGYADFNNGITVDSAVNINAVSASTGQSIFNINNSSSNSIFSIRHMSAAFGSLVKAGAFEGRNSYWGEEFNVGHTTNCSTTAALSAGTVNAYARGDVGGNANSTVACASGATTTVNGGELNVADVIGTTTIANNQCIISSQNAANGIERISALTTTAVASSKTACAETLAANTTTSNKIYTTTNLPVIAAKVKVQTFTANATGSVFVIGANIVNHPGTDGAGVNLPNTGIFFTNCSTFGASGAPSGCSNTTWYGVVASGGSAVTGVQTCSVGSGSLTAQFSYLRIEVRATNDIHFYADYNTSDGINESECGTGVTGASSTSGMAPWWEVKTIGNAIQTNNLDIDYYRSWQDDNTPVESLAPENTNTNPDGTEVINDPPVAVEDSPSSNPGGFFSFNAATSEDTVFNKDVYVHGTLFADKIKANQIEGLEIFTDKISSLQQKLAQALSPTASAQTTTASTSTNALPLNLNVDGALSVGADAQFHGNVLFYKLVTFTEKTLFNNDVTFAAHITTSGDKPTLDIKPAAGAATAPADNPDAKLAKATADGNDSSGLLSLDIGDNSTTGELLGASFNKQFDKRPQILLTPATKDAASLKYYVVSTKTGFKIVAADPPPPGANLQFFYWVVQ